MLLISEEVDITSKIIISAGSKIIEKFLRTFLLLNFIAIFFNNGVEANTDTKINIA